MSDRILAVAKSLMPISEFEEELPGSSITLDNIYHSTSTQILKVVAYAISNNFPGHSNRTEIYSWLRDLGALSPDIIQRLQDPSNQALLQGLLRLAVEEGDIPLASTLLNAGADPNENTCVFEGCPIPLRPLQYSCLDGNFTLVKELLRAEAQIDRPQSGWSCSPLLFAIYAYFEGYWRSLPEQATMEAVRTDDRDVSDDIDGDDDNGDGDQWKNSPIRSLLTLIQQLLDAGADVNAVPEDLDDMEHFLKEWYDEVEPSGAWYSLICEKHSALTLASSNRCPELVDFLVRNGAETSFHIDGARSPLRECLYTTAERWDFKPSSEDNVLQRNKRPTELLGLLETAKTLIMAKVDVNDHKPCHNYYCYGEGHWNFECYSALDLGILTQDRELVDVLWSAGANPTRHSFNLAIKARDYSTFCRLLESEADFPRWAVASDEGPDVGDNPCWYLESRNATDQQKRRAMILAAIQLGDCVSLERLTRSRDYSNLVENCDGSRRAIEKCSARGDHDTLVCLLQSNILSQGSLASISGSSVKLAIRGGHLKTVDVLLKAGADVNATDTWATPLWLAIERKSKELAQKLLDRGAAVEVPGRGNLLVEAIWGGDHDIIQLLMSHTSRDRLGYCSAFDAMMSPLAVAILGGQWAIFDQLLQLGASTSRSSQHVDKPQRYGSPLWAAVRRKCITTAEWLINNGAEANDELALQAAAEDEDSTMLRLLVKQLSTAHRRGEGNVLHVALQASVVRNRLWNFRLILQSNIVDVRASSDIIHHVLKSYGTHRHEFLRSLLHAGACLDTIRTEDYSRGPTTTLLEAISRRDPECVRMILETQAGTNEELPPETAFSPLQLAAFEGSLEIVRLLLDTGHNPDTVSTCARSHKWYRHPIGTSVQNAIMMKGYGILKALLQHGANPNSTTRHCPHSPLQMVCREGSLELVEVLLEYGADVNAPPAREFGATALQFAAIGGYAGIAHLLLEKGADVNAEPAEIEGRTALEGAAEHGRIDMVQLLRNAGADISESGGQGQYERALRRAWDNGHHATAKRLQSFLS